MAAIFAISYMADSVNASGTLSLVLAAQAKVPGSGFGPEADI